MNPWTRLTDGAGTDFERLLINSVLHDSIPPASRRNVAARLGLDLARIGLAEPPSPRSDALGTSGAARDAAGAGALLKGTLIAVIGGLSAVSAVSSLEPSSEPSSSEPAALAMAPLRAAPSMTEPALVQETIAAAVKPTATTPAPAHRARKAVAARRVAPSSATAAASALADPLLLEVQQLDRVRAALGSGRSLDALRALDEYASKFPRGALQLEATVLRIRTLERAGRFGSAARLARRALELPGSERYRLELARIAGGESNPADTTEPRSTLRDEVTR